MVAGVDLRLIRVTTDCINNNLTYLICLKVRSIDLLIHHESIIADLQNYVNNPSKMILHIQASNYSVLEILTFG